jgi:hypothetical protein
MFDLFRRKPKPKTRLPSDDETKAEIANTIADLLRLQLMLLPPEYDGIDDDRGIIFRKSIGSVYGYIDSILTTMGYDMGDNDVGIPITFHVLRKLFPNGRAERYVEFLMYNMNDEKVVLGMMHGGQQWLDYGRPESKGVAMGLFQFILEDRAAQAAPGDVAACETSR